MSKGSPAYQRSPSCRRTWDNNLKLATNDVRNLFPFRGHWLLCSLVIPLLDSSGGNVEVTEGGFRVFTKESLCWLLDWASSPTGRLLTFEFQTSGHFYPKVGRQLCLPYWSLAFSSYLTSQRAFFTGFPSPNTLCFLTSPQASPPSVCLLATCLTSVATSVAGFFPSLPHAAAEVYSLMALELCF